MTIIHPLANYAGITKELQLGDILTNASNTCFKVIQSSHGFSVGNAIYHSGSAFVKAKADNPDTLGLFIVSQVLDTNTFIAVSNGYISGLTGLTTGQYYYVSAATAGALTATEPAAGLYSNPILFAISTTEGVVLPFRPSLSTTSPANSGWVDITPVWQKDDGTSPFVMTNISGNRWALAANSTNSLKRVINEYHIPHDIVLNQTDGNIYLHLHWESADNATGNIIAIARIFCALRDGSWSSEFTSTYTLTPSTSLSTGKQIVSELALPTGCAAYLVPDALWYVNIERNRGANATDTYANTWYYHTADLHVQSDVRPTTSKDPGTGWIKI
jgi:hypothetical protein